MDKVVNVQRRNGAGAEALDGESKTRGSLQPRCSTRPHIRAIAGTGVLRHRSALQIPSPHTLKKNIFSLEITELWKEEENRVGRWLEDGAHPFL